jgi:pyruvate formate lyase activating enzyme
MQDIPPTPIHTLKEAKAIAIEEGIKYVYLGNV